MDVESGNDSAPVSFAPWSDKLESSPLPDALRTAFRREIMAFLHHCKTREIVATAALAKSYLTDRDDPELELTQAALRWFVTRGSAVPRHVGVLLRLLEARGHVCGDARPRSR